MVTTPDFFDSSTGGRVSGRLTISLRMFEEAKLATWRSDEVRRPPLDGRPTRGRQPKMIDYLRRSCEPCLHDRIQGRATVASENDIVDCLACCHRTGKGSRCVVVWIGGAVNWYILFGWTYATAYGLVYFSLNFGRRLSTVWYILIRTGDEAMRSWAAKSCWYIAN